MATAVGVVCLPLIGVAGVLVVGATVGATAGGVSEYVQQKEVGEEVDMTRVGIKAIGGAVKGGAAAIPGVRMASAFGKAVNAAGQTLRPVLSSAVGDAVGDAAVAAAANAITPGVVCHAVGAAGGVLASAAAKDTLMAAGGVLATGAAEDIGCAVQSGKTVKEAAEDAALNGACQAAVVPVAVGAVGVGVACCAACVASNKKDPDPKPVPVPAPKPKPVPKPDPKPKPVPKPDPTDKGEKVDRTEESIISGARATRIRTTTGAEDSHSPQDGVAPQRSEVTTGQLLQNTRAKTIQDTQKAREKCHPQQVIDMEKKCYEKDLKVAAEIRK